MECCIGLYAPIVVLALHLASIGPTHACALGYSNIMLHCVGLCKAYIHAHVSTTGQPYTTTLLSPTLKILVCRLWPASLSASISY